MRYLEPAAEAPEPTETAVIVPVPAAEVLVAEHRDRLDPAAGWGVPAHVTVLYPFVAPGSVTHEVLDRLREAVRGVASFDCRFERTAWFGEDVVWLDPSPSEPFRALTAAVWRAFPDFPPYGGAHDDPTPHLTVADGLVASLEEMRTAEQAVTPGLPLDTVIDRVLLVAGTYAPRSWRVLADVALA